MNWKKSLAIVSSALVIMGLVAGCGSDTSSDKKVLTFAAETTYPPFEFSEGDTYKGFDVDLSQAIAKEMGH